MRNTSTRTRLVTGAITVMVLAVVGLVYAAWTTNGSGNGYAKAGEAKELTTVEPEATTYANKLYPGTDGDVRIKIKNENPYPVEVTEVASNGTVTASGGTGTCTTTGVSLNSPQATAIEVEAEGTAEEVLTKAAHMSNESETGCQNATFTIPVKLKGVSNAP